MGSVRLERDVPAEAPRSEAELLVGVMFATAKELRHQAEQILGRLFVPVEVRASTERAAMLVLRPDGIGELHVHARRERHWHPFRIVRVETAAR